MSVDGLPITFAGREPRQEAGLVGHVLLVGPTPKGPGKPSDVGVRRDPGRSPGVVSFQGSWRRSCDGGWNQPPGPGSPSVQWVCSPQGCQVGGMVRFRSLPTVSAVVLSPALARAPGGHWNSGEAHRSQAGRSGARQEGGGRDLSCPSLACMSSIEQRWDPETPSGPFGCEMTLGSAGVWLVCRDLEAPSLPSYSGFHALDGQS